MKRVCLALLSFLLTGAVQAKDSPNVVAMLADNVGHGDIGAYGAGDVRGMPNAALA